jgi:hypothetical protein
MLIVTQKTNRDGVARVAFMAHLKAGTEVQRGKGTSRVTPASSYQEDERSATNANRFIQSACCNGFFNH